MQDKIDKILSKSENALNEIKEKLAKDFSSFGTAIGGGTKENPTIKPTSSTSQDVRDSTSGGSKGSWFGMSEDSKKEKLNYFDNGQWEMSEIKEDGK